MLRIQPLRYGFLEIIVDRKHSALYHWLPLSAGTSAFRTQAKIFHRQEAQRIESLDDRSLAVELDRRRYLRQRQSQEQQILVIRRQGPEIFRVQIVKDARQLRQHGIAELGDLGKSTRLPTLDALRLR